MTDICSYLVKTLITTTDKDMTHESSFFKD